MSQSMFPAEESTSTSIDALSQNRLVPTQAQTAVFYSSELGMELKKLEIPALKKGEALIKIEYTTLCRSDVNTYCGKRIEKSPTILGHEIVGRIVSFGPDEILMDQRGKMLRLNDRVTWAIFATDPNDVLYIQGIPQKVSKLFKYGHEQVNEHQTLHGGLSEYIILRPHTPIIKINEQIPLPVAATINCTISTIAGAIRLAGDLAGKSVLISGAGMLGIIAITMCKKKQAGKITVIDTNKERLNKALVFGADHILVADEYLDDSIYSTFYNESPFDVVLEVSGNNKAIQQTINYLKIGGSAIWLGATFPQPDIGISAEQIVRRLLTLKGLHNYNIHDFINAVEFIEEYHDHFPFKTLIYDSFKLNQVNEAFQYAITHNPFRVGISMD